MSAEGGAADGASMVMEMFKISQNLQTIFAQILLGLDRAAPFVLPCRTTVQRAQYAAIAARAAAVSHIA